MQWISTIIGRRRLEQKPPLLPCIVRLRQGNVGLEILEYQLPCGHPAFRVDLEWYIEQLDTWVPLGSFQGFMLDDSLSLLKRARECIDNLEGGH